MRQPRHAQRHNPPRPYTPHTPRLCVVTRYIQTLPPHTATCRLSRLLCIWCLGHSNLGWAQHPFVVAEEARVKRGHMAANGAEMQKKRAKVGGGRVQEAALELGYHLRGECKGVELLGGLR
jgi:hypothetical protein